MLLLLTVRRWECALESVCVCVMERLGVRRVRRRFSGDAVHCTVYTETEAAEEQQMYADPSREPFISHDVNHTKTNWKTEGPDGMKSCSGQRAYLTARDCTESREVTVAEFSSLAIKSLRRVLWLHVRL